MKIKAQSGEKVERVTVGPPEMGHGLVTRVAERAPAVSTRMHSPLPSHGIRRAASAHSAAPTRTTKVTPYQRMAEGVGKIRRTRVLRALCVHSAPNQQLSAVPRRKRGFW